MPEHHPIFQDFIPRDFIHDSFLGTVSRREFTSEAMAQSVIACGPAGLPAFNEEYFEWLDLLESIKAWKPGSGPYTFMELGAGYGRWSVRAAFARKLARIIAVEAEPTHFDWLRQNFVDNGLKSDRHKLIHAAVSDVSTGCLFLHGRPSEWYGQRIAGPGESGLSTKSVTLSQLLEHEFVDLIDMDIQGHEFVVIQAGLGALNAKVKRLHIATHSPEIESDLRVLLWNYGWKALHLFGTGQKYQTEVGVIEFQDGVQSWVNPRFL